MKTRIIKISLPKIMFTALFMLIVFGENIMLHGNQGITEYKLWLTMISIAVIINVVVTLYIFRRLNIKIVSMSTFFIILSYVFHFGQVIIHGLFSNYSFTLVDAVGSYSKSSIDCLLFSLNIVSIITLFVIMFSEDKKNNSCSFDQTDVSPYAIRRIGYIALLFTFPVQAYVCIKQYFMSRIYIYGTGQDLNGTLFQIGILSIIGFVFLLFGYSNDKKKIRIVFVLSAIWYIATMISGSRIYAVIAICILLFFYLRLHGRIGIGKWLLYGFLAIVFLGLLNSVMHVRSVETVTIGAIIRDFINPSSNMFLGTLEEFGGSIYTVKVGFEEIPVNVPYNYGKSYIESLAFTGLNIGGVLKPLLKNISFTSMYTYKYNYGGSYIAELYYNFGWLSIFVAPIWGILLVKISDKLNDFISAKQYIKASYFIMVFYGFLLWIRGYANAMSRGVIWGAVFIWIVTKIKIRGKIEFERK